MKRHLDPAAHDAPANGQKRRKQYTEQDAELARLFDRLADEARDVRLNAAKELVLKLSSSPTAELANKAIVRLIRGLNSGRKAARFGFFVALTETLRQLYGSSSKEIPGLEPNIHGLVKLVAELTTPEGKASGQEKRDYLLGRVFGYKAIIQSSILVQPNAPEECWANVLEQLFKLAREKPWLREECGMILCEAVKAIAQEKGQQRLVKQIVDGLCSDGLAKTPEGVSVWITVQREIPDMELPQGVWHKEDPLSTKDRQTLANVMKENFTKTSDGANETGKKVKGSSQTTTLSFSWDVVISAFFQRHGDDPSRFANFWADIVDNNLFSASSSPEQKSKGLQLFTRMLGNAPKWALPSIFSPNLMRCLINQRNDSERFLHNAAKAPLDEMRTRSKKEPETAAPFLENLITKHGSLHFDQITKNKTVEGVLGHANDVALEQIVPLFKRLIYRPEEQDSKAAEAQRRTVADMVVSAVRSRNKENAIGNDSWLREVLVGLTELAYFTPTASSSPDDLPLPAVSEASRNMFQGRLTSCLAHLLSSKLDTEMDYPYIVVSAIRSKSKSSKSLSLVFQADKGISKAVKQAHKQVEEITEKLLKAKDKKKPALRAFKLLFSLAIVQVYNGDPDTVSILEELAVCYESAFQKGADKSAFQLLTEVLLSFAAKPSVLFRKLSEQVFTVFASELTAEGLHSMIDILSKKESMSGQQDLFDQQGSEDGEDASEDDEDEQDSDVEMVEADGSDVEEVEEASDVDEEEEEDEDEEGGEDGSDADDEELEKFNAALAKTLNTSMPTGEGEDSDDDDEADMDDDQMMALEPHLTKIFKQRQEAANKSKKKDNKDAKATMINFKNRVLDLLLIFVKQQHANPLALDVIIPLLRLIRQTTAKQLSEKATNLLKQYFDATKKGMPTLDKDEDVDRVWSLLEDIHTEVTKDASKLHAGACSRASLFVAKVLVARDEEGKAESYGKVADLYTRTQKQWYADPKSKVHPSFFNEWINWSVGMRKNQ
ncbi:DNA polymerase phi-domain-containing protein [Macrophomina phaseolina]|uniref:DNA polymerase phi-domain-containing protein n=1 Tax=Macrophomina phaseolina TaxID=35725 RepID=A0ABQ8GK41_9PEZI|nr:DNA polymerase phi-domain-containing protein [Macrophomina phaseolina]